MCHVNDFLALYDLGNYFCANECCDAFLLKNHGLDNK